MKTKIKIFKPILIKLLLLVVIITGGVNQIKAQAPNAPEAASFEPVDATDMVNLVTGNLSYVLPLLNVPSPEGGYPISLSYHAGIAMDQESSWVGLGWNINPGSINRAVNGFPDDWGETNYSEFFYDNGWTNNYYSLSLGATFKETISVGLGISWGTNQSLGGFVEASYSMVNEKTGIGPSIGGRLGTNGFSLNGGYSFGKGSSLNGSIGTSGIGLGYGYGKGITSLGVGLNINPNTGLSGSASISTRGMGFNNSSLGISFNSSGVSMNGKVGGIGSGIFNTPGQIDGGDYVVDVSKSGFYLPAFIFYVSFSHTKVIFSLFKYANLYTSGTLYPFEANKSQPNQSIAFSNEMEENHFMDANMMQPFYKTSVYNDLIDEARKHDRNNLILPDYDNYTVSAQGLSGNISPFTYHELNLSHRGREKQNNDNEYVTYLNESYNSLISIEDATGNTPIELQKKYFTFSNVYNSYLKSNRSNYFNADSNLSTSENLISKFITADDNSNGFLTGNRKKEGNHIITYTNKEIRDGNLSGFIDAKENNGLLNRSNTEVFLDEGIGAYKVTSMDGKTYHYSLPVYQFESTFKNYNNKKPNGDFTTSEDENFFEIQKTKPYATHWLLTAITGPDYYDKNGNKKVDEGDYGYWVEFDYGKWSDGFIWQTPNGRSEEIIDKIDQTKKSFSYSWGRKQIYYLDAISTRTHTALFVKNLREDNKSRNFNTSNSPVDINSFSFYNNAKKFENDNYIWYIGFPGSKFYTEESPGYVFVNNTKTEGSGSVTQTFNVNHLRGKAGLAKYINIPINKTLKLEKILVIKNDNLPPNLKSSGFLINSQKGFESINTYYHDVEYFNTGISSYLDYTNKIFYRNPVKLNEFDIHQHQKVIDIKDIEGLNLESQAVQVIDFEHDYSLADKAPNADTGRLTLKTVNFKGKKGVQVVPPYKFDYKDSYIDYNANDIDAWGYHKTNPSVWSLNKIKTPTGGEILIDYGKDEYVAEAAYIPEKEFNHVLYLTATGTKVKFFIENSSSILSNYFNVNNYYKISYSVSSFVYSDGNCGGQCGGNEDIDDRLELLKVTSIGSNWVEFETNTTNSDFHYATSTNNCLNWPSEQYDCINNFVVFGRYDGMSNPIEGGGIITNSITVNDGIKNIIKTEYIYNNGITSYAPSKEPKGIPYVSELPAPMILYSEVTMRTKDVTGALLGSTVYEFENLEPIKEEVGYIFSLGEIFRVKENQNTTFENGKVKVNKYTIESRLGNIGRIKSIKSYNNLDQLLNKTENHYKTNLNADSEIGVTQESFKSYKRFRKDKNNDNDFLDFNEETFYISATSKINYPSVLEKVTNTQGNFSVSKYLDKYDVLTGELLETRTFASDGVAFKSKIVPAYKKYIEMGSKIDDPSYANMLTQTTASYTSLLEIDPNNPNLWNESVLSASITTWNNNWNYWDYKGDLQTGNDKGPNIWRKHESYVWKGDIDTDGMYLNFSGEYDGFVWGVGASQTNVKWQKASEVTKYDHYSMMLESKDINGNFASVKMGDTHSKVIAVSNALYTEMYYSGAEYESVSGFFDSEIKSTGVIKSKFSHTGDYMVSIGTGQNAFELKIPARSDRNTPRKQKFKVSVWVKTSQKDNVVINVGGTIKTFNTNETQIAGDWSLLNGYIDISPQETIIAINSSNGTIQLDDFRLHPITSSMTSYVYNEFDEVSYIIGSNGLSTNYIYDAAGRLKETKVEILDNPSAGIVGGFKTVSKNSYNYKNQ